MHLAQAHKLGVGQARDQPQHLFLRPPLDVGLKAHHVVERAGDVVLAQLHRGIRPPARTRVAQTDRAHGAKGE